MTVRRGLLRITLARMHETTDIVAATRTASTRAGHRYQSR